MAENRFRALVPEPLQPGAADWPHFVARVYAQPLMLLAMPYRRDAGGPIHPVDADGNPSNIWLTTPRQRTPFKLSDKRWAPLAGGDGWRFAADLKSLGLDPAKCDGGLVLFIIDAYMNLLFDSGAQPLDAAAPPPRLNTDALDKAVKELEERDRTLLEQATAGWAAGQAAASAAPVAYAARGTAAPSPAAAPPAAPIELALAACRYPAGVLDRAPGPSVAASQRLAEWLAARPAQRLLVMTGDSIYIDATAGLFDPAMVPAVGVHGGGRAGRALGVALQAAYREADQRNRRFGNVRARLQSLDDHEIIDNWEPSAHPGRNAMLDKRLQICRDAFLASSARDAVPTARAVGKLPAPLDQQRVVDGLRFFIADTRTERGLRGAAKPGDARIMRGPQFARLRKWLAPDATEPGAYRRVVVSPSMLLPRRLSTQENRHAASRSDAWDGFPRSLHDMLAAIAQHPNLRCVFLSGDEHLPCVISARIEPLDSKGQASHLLSVHAGALYAPWPFANSRQEDFSDERRFDFVSDLASKGQRYRCTIQARIFPSIGGDGFVSLAYPADADVEPTVCWHAAEGAAAVVWPAGSKAC
jgi:PhoD-like phosphatase